VRFQVLLLGGDAEGERGEKRGQEEEREEEEEEEEGKKAMPSNSRETKANLTIRQTRFLRRGCLKEKKNAFSSEMKQKKPSRELRRGVTTQE